MDRARRALWLAALVAPGCRHPVQPFPDVAAADAGTDSADVGADADAAPPPPSVDLEPPAPPSPPVLQDWPCPPRWSPVAAEVGKPWAFSYCAPPLPRPCEGATFQPPGELMCQAVGSACPPEAERWPSDATIRERAAGFAGQIRFVDGAAGDGGDGSRERPYRTLDAARQEPLAAGSILALARGTVAGGVALDANVALVGACVAEAVVTGPAGAPALSFGGSVAALVVDLTVTGPGAGIRIGGGPGPVTLRSLVVTDVAGYGVQHEQAGGPALMERILVRNVSSVGGRGRGVYLYSSARLTADRVVVSEVLGAGFEAAPGQDGGGPPTLTLRDSAVRDVWMVENATEGDGAGVALFGGAFFTATRVAFDGIEGPVVYTTQAGGSPPRVELEDVAFRGVPGQERGPMGVSTTNSASFSGRRLLFSGLGGSAFGLGTRDEGASGGPSVDVEDVVVLAPRTDVPLAAAATTFGSGHLSLRRVLVVSPRLIGIGAIGRGAEQPTVVAEDVVIRGLEAYLEPVSGDLYPPGLTVLGSGFPVVVHQARLSISRAVIADSAGQALAAVGNSLWPAELTATDCLVDSMSPLPLEWSSEQRDNAFASALPAVGISLSGRVDAVVSRVYITAPEGGGILAIGYPDLGVPVITAEDLVVDAVASHPSGHGAIGVLLATGAQLDATRAVVSRTSWVGVSVHGHTGEPQTAVRLNQFEVSVIDAAPCGAIPEGQPGACIEEGRSEAAGLGLLVRDGAQATVDGFRISGCVMAGVALAEAGELDARDGMLTENGIGLNLMVQDYDVDRVTDGVFIFGNRKDVAQEQLVLPDPLGALAGLPGQTL